jgi:hypothetical protein
MPSHARQVDERDIWSVVHYIRKLQRERPVAPPPPTAAATAPATEAAAAPPAASSKGGR